MEENAEEKEVQWVADEEKKSVVITFHSRSVYRKFKKMFRIFLEEEELDEFTEFCVEEWDQ